RPGGRSVARPRPLLGRHGTRRTGPGHGRVRPGAGMVHRRDPRRHGRDRGRHGGPGGGRGETRAGGLEPPQTALKIGTEPTDQLGMSDRPRFHRPLVASVVLALVLSLFGLAGTAGASPSSDEHDFLRMLNQSRTSAGLPALVSDPTLAATSRSWSGTMAAAGK